MHDIVTERLVLRPLQLEDVLAFAAYRSDPDVARYQSWDTAYSQADGERLVQAQQGVDLGDPGPWLQLAAVDRVTGALCGGSRMARPGLEPGTPRFSVVCSTN